MASASVSCFLEAREEWERRLPLLPLLSSAPTLGSGEERPLPDEKQEGRGRGSGWGWARGGVGVGRVRCFDQLVLWKVVAVQGLLCWAGRFCSSFTRMIAFLRVETCCWVDGAMRTAVVCMYLRP